MRHAYLIMAHNKFEQLSELLRCLDYENNDVFLHIDAKVPFSEHALTYNLRKSKLYLVDRVKVNWGGASQIWAELNLIEAAMNIGGYGYLHLLTGIDLPLKTQSEIHDFFAKNNGKQFIYIENKTPEWARDRIKYFYPFQEYFDRENKFGNGIRKACVITQSLLGVNRIPQGMKIGLESAYFDITEEFALYIMAQKGKVQQIFAKTFCADEMFIQTLYLNSRFNEAEGRYTYSGEKSWVAEQYMNICRAVDWKRGQPYTYQDDDFNDLMLCGCNFARKFDMAANPVLFHKIVDRVANNERH